MGGSQVDILVGILNRPFLHLSLWQPPVLEPASGATISNTLFESMIVNPLVRQNSNVRFRERPVSSKLDDTDHLM